MSEKRIAKIYFEANVFLTTQGELYGYQLIGDRVKCKKLNASQKIAFWEGQNIYHNAPSVHWVPVSSGISQPATDSHFMHFACTIQR